VGCINSSVVLRSDGYLRAPLAPLDNTCNCAFEWMPASKGLQREHTCLNQLKQAAGSTNCS
jgi:hypothetical protein